MIDPGEVRLLRDSLRHLLVECAGRDVLSTLTDTGWAELYREAPGAAAGTLFDLQGEHLTGTPVLAAVMASVLDPTSDELTERVVLPPFGNACARPARLHADGAASVDGLAAASLSGGSLLVAAATSDSSVTLLRIAHDALTSAAVEGVDPSLGLARVTGTVAAGDLDQLGCPDPADRWERAVALGRQCVAQEIVGNARAALRTATDHARGRTQFGAPIGSFQAVKHRLADAEVALQVAEVAVEEGWRNPGRFTRLMAKVLAGNAGREVNRQVQQVLGGIGFTWEHGFHHRVRRTIALDSLLGSSTALQKELGRELMVVGSLPDLGPL